MIQFLEQVVVPHAEEKKQEFLFSQWQQAQLRALQQHKARKREEFLQVEQNTKREFAEAQKQQPLQPQQLQQPQQPANTQTPAVNEQVDLQTPSISKQVDSPANVQQEESERLRAENELLKQQIAALLANAPISPSE